MPAYNAEKFIGEAIESVVNQTYLEWNLIIYNDGSTDRTKEVINEYVNKYSEKIRMIDGAENRGTVYGLNTLLKYADGDYACWLSADDMYCERMLESSVEFLNNNNKYDMVFSEYETIDEKGDFVSSYPYNRFRVELNEGKSFQPYRYLLTEGCCAHGCAFMFRNYCFKKVGKFNASYRYAHDYEMWLRMAAEFNIGYFNDVNVKGRVYATQISKQGNNEIDAIDVLLDFIHNEELFEKMYIKAGYNSKNEALYNIIKGQLKKYKQYDKEFANLRKRLLDIDDELLYVYKKEFNDESIWRILENWENIQWKQDEEFFSDDGQYSYLKVLCEINNVDAILINKPAIRFDRFTGNTFDRFNKGLMRSNDIVIGKVKKQLLEKFVCENVNDFRYAKIIDKEEIFLGITYFMYKNTDIVKKLEMENLHITNNDIWWSLLEYCV